MTKQAPTALSLFSGIGGLCEGVKQAGFSITGAVEHDQFAAPNYRLNFPGIPLFEGDIAKFLPEKNKKQFNEHFNTYLQDKNLDLIFGGPPCQGFSQIGPRDVGDPRNEMYLEVCRLARQLKPKFILIENVPNMLLMKGGMFKERITNALVKSGYNNIGLRILSAADYGVPQERRRVFFVAARTGLLKLDMQDILDSTAEEMKSGSVSVNDAISDLPEKVAADSGITIPYPKAKKLSAYQREMRLDGTGETYSKAEKLSRYHAIEKEIMLHNHHTKEIQEKRLKLIKLLEPGKKADSLPKHVWNNARPEKWRRFDGSKPAHTLLAQMHRDLSEWVHPEFHRWITVREALRLQSFHDGFVLRGSEWQQLKQIGNAVPPLLGRIPASAVMLAMETLKGKEISHPKGKQLSFFLNATVT